MIKIAYSPIYKYSLPEGHRFPMEKYTLLPEQLLYEGLVTNDHFFHPDALDEQSILRTHSLEYWNKLQSLSLTRKEIRAIGFPVTDKLITRGRHIAKGTIDCVTYAMENGVALNIAGGTHHAFRDYGEGFCVFNDFAIAAHHFLASGQIQKFLIIDLDVHQGNGTAHIFKDDDRVFTFSMHGAKNYPIRKTTSDWDIGLPDGITDEPYLNILHDALPQLIKKVQPECILYLSGVDVLSSDKLGRLGLSLHGSKKRDEMVFETAAEHNLPVAVSMGGGYNKNISTLVTAHAQTFRAAFDIFG